MGPGGAVDVDIRTVQNTFGYFPQAEGAQQFAAPQQSAAPQKCVAPAQSYTAPQQSDSQYVRSGSLQQRSSESVTLLGDAYPGKEYSFQAPSGRTVTFSVPPGTGPGATITVSY
mmetsp:Transcript_69555/g.226564  ORF Transcript_69555/g.226564 Transcript_69555/m.226564 type:complete len:114 (-) Transcript_69555:64-405(-)|eukprot:CAMPEP_0203898892 /NCGR_PEP_ID=MMETSP0359-20131031/41372_1 /ASSEMBLY_ACC=CAM_ASM_000338 /TAXON_ID=268821 /ORGANISM="Scrippsiella Hangoei, Strain SHTV-5" /LENGTH=113 /DNA_ID=CAMNT_0050822047 /DNA_START=179 /DNA_END=520 /DNA_ORIENTATION=+